MSTAIGRKGAYLIEILEKIVFKISVYYYDNEMIKRIGEKKCL